MDPCSRHLLADPELVSTQPTRPGERRRPDDAVNRWPAIRVTIRGSSSRFGAQSSSVTNRKEVMRNSTAKLAHFALTAAVLTLSTTPATAQPQAPTSRSLSAVTPSAAHSSGPSIQATPCGFRTVWKGGSPYWYYKNCGTVRKFVEVRSAKGVLGADACVWPGDDRELLMKYEGTQARVVRNC